MNLTEEFIENGLITGKTTKRADQILASMKNVENLEKRASVSLKKKITKM